MEMRFSEFFHNISKDRGKGHQPIPNDWRTWPEEWTTTQYKSYPRFPKIELGGNPPPADFFDLIKHRKSRYDFSGVLLTKDELSIFLKYSCGNMDSYCNFGQRRRAQPSGGGLFPIEVYPIIFKPSSDLEAGLYHYNVKNHQLDVLYPQEEDYDLFFTYSWVKKAPLIIVMTAVFERNQSKYGEYGYRHILLEAGHIGQNMYLVSEALGLKCCALTGSKDENLEKFIDVDGVTESVVYAMAVGK